MVGMPGSGKSYWLKENAWPQSVVSRDKIRFSMLKEGEDYFEHEPEAYREFVKQIQEKLDGDFGRVYADATHISWASRRKLLNRLNLEGVKVHIILIKTGLKECKYNNSLREGKERVDESVIEDFYNWFEDPKLDRYDYESITEVRYRVRRDEDGR